MKNAATKLLAEHSIPLAVITNLISTTLNIPDDSSSNISHGMIFVLLSGLLIAPFIETFVFQHIIYKAFYKKPSVYFISSILLFYTIHIDGRGFFIALLPGLLGGANFSLCYFRANRMKLNAFMTTSLSHLLCNSLIIISACLFWR
ncbi:MULTISPECIES: CPBP family glutamic-type intramembrane protease [Asaia]|uniref:CPBP family glutamic-type intramembrane protease n=1 Tax=Asaia TaxID=91914 RepID=UPI00255753AC|nr:CPBP family glutamic-type intramembrane protease [Asaia sp. HumB]MDL2172502.1 CPBP family glutamic-type intramembrane protease [Asaia sp. HumB]